ncbi:MAG: substrate-binding domain-containing protein [Erysipelotrichaceae bacterium]|nr:substrate-binding domain-containing protein [Erysipelotrichaceae bacterium]MDY5251763.1 substrate-binding domain-containing protein [Erysipelotrichaceae bacterium]
MKKILCVLFSLMLLAGCSSTPASDETATTEATQESTSEASGINVYTRDATSGTREAFEKAIDLEELTATAIEVSSNGDMATKVGADENGIGYASLSTDFEANNVKPLNFEGVEPSEETVLDGSYGMQRPFSYVTRAAGDFGSEEKEQLVAAFIDYLCNSTEGMLVVESAGGVVDLSKGTPWAELSKNHPIVNQDNSAITISTAGSTSVEKTLKAALESFVPLAGNFQFVMNQTGSGDGYKRVLGEEKSGVNAADIGFASRSFNEDEDVTTSMSSGQYAIDAVVTIVNANNSLSDITADSLNQIYAGTLTDFNAVK